MLKQLRFLTGDSTPTPRYNQFRSATSGGAALAQGLREGWADIFLADQRAHEKSAAQLKDLFKSVTGAGDASAGKMGQTFRSLATLADWQAPPSPTDVPPEDEDEATVSPVSPQPSRWLPGSMVN